MTPHDGVLFANFLDFPEVLKSFLLLLTRIGPKLWEGEGEEYPQVVFNTIKDNPAYADTLLTEQPSRSHWTMQWMEACVKSLDESPGLQSLLPLMVQYLCEELQHERFKNVRASAICIAAKVRSLLSSWPFMNLTRV